MDGVLADGAVVPPLWTLEVGNVLALAMRRRHLERAAMTERLNLLDMLPIETDTQGTGPVWRSAVLALADTEALAVYDAVYLELAIPVAVSGWQALTAHCVTPPPGAAFRWSHRTRCEPNARALTSIVESNVEVVGLFDQHRRAPPHRHGRA